jgi:insertion element IS1 protein InsB
MSRLRKWKIWRYCVDNWKVYPMEIPEEQLITGKNGTVGIERNNCRQRHWFARFKRKSIVVSKSLHMVDLTMALFARSRQWSEGRYSNILWLILKTRISARLSATGPISYAGWRRNCNEQAVYFP